MTRIRCAKDSSSEGRDSTGPHLKMRPAYFRPGPAPHLKMRPTSALPSDREAVLSHIRASHQDAGPRVDHHGLIPAHRAAAVADRVTSLGQPGAHVGGDAALDGKRVASMSHARGVAGFLHVHAEVDHIDDD